MITHEILEDNLMCPKTFIAGYDCDAYRSCKDCCGKIVTEYEDFIKADAICKFAEWLTKSDYANGYFDTGSKYVSVDKVLAEYYMQKEVNE